MDNEFAKNGIIRYVSDIPPLVFLPTLQIMMHALYKVGHRDAAVVNRAYLNLM